PRKSYSGICRIFSLRVKAGKSPIVFEDGGQLRDYVYVGDVATANVLALEDHRTDYESYNVAGDAAISVAEYARTVLRVLHSDCPPQFPGYYRFGDTRNIVSDNTKLKAMGWHPTLKVEEIVAEYARWIGEIGVT